ncbi:cytochrome c oxidase assembly protein CtaG [Methylobacterium gnaphalii]|uniref:Cytochrome c oxidase assembly protein CtaG n=2 Tax=Methylobacterium gnaphalii TaxID=1010610 RepID=A0A512JDZ8_9HYPH|nr:cytochrome c oxidase assembly protein CtaG [Methylobacterium gnaphalii]GLS51193.1 cytochrome c oxidase assembly protein CtaG [Methylobacterium gnaphalii]
MTGLAFASVPLYDLFCKATGYDGTPRVGTAPMASADTASAKALRVHFDTNVAPNLTWRFQPEVTSVDAVPGETKTVFFKVTNTGSKPATGIAAFNVQPGLMGSYFVKVECFCFSEHTLQPGESADYPLVFYVDKGLRKDPDIGDLGEMTLSYTYFASRNGSPQVAAEGKGTGAGTRTNF